jgi:hypothetical protein
VFLWKGTEAVRGVNLPGELESCLPPKQQGSFGIMNLNYMSIALKRGMESPCLGRKTLLRSCIAFGGAGQEHFQRRCNSGRWQWQGMLFIGLKMVARKNHRGDCTTGCARLIQWPRL